MRTVASFAVLLTACVFLSFSVIQPDAALPAKAKRQTMPPPVVFTENEIIPFDLTVFIPCAAGGTGEEVELSGNLHVLFHVTINGNNAVVKTHAQPQGISGIGLTTGRSYQATGVTQDVSKTSASNGQFAFSFVNNFKIIGQGPRNNYLLHETFHVTFNAKGVLTTEVEKFSVECR